MEFWILLVPIKKLCWFLECKFAELVDNSSFGSFYRVILVREYLDNSVVLGRQALDTLPFTDAVY